MRSERLLFAQAPRRVSLTPILVALLTLVAIGLAGLLFTVWPRDRATSALRPVAGQAASTSRSHGGLSLPPTAPQRPGRTRPI